MTWAPGMQSELNTDKCTEECAVCTKIISIPCWLNLFHAHSNHCTRQPSRQFNVQETSLSPSQQGLISKCVIGEEIRIVTTVASHVAISSAINQRVKASFRQEFVLMGCKWVLEDARRHGPVHCSATRRLLSQPS